jgi:hypothetical protein
MQHYHAVDGAWARMDAERAFGKAVRARRRASLLRRCAACLRLVVHEQAAPRTAARHGYREIPLAEITGTLEPNRAEQFDSAFRPSSSTRARWLRVWLAANGGVELPPIRVVASRDGYAIRDGHHRVSVARARGATSIDAIVG